MFIYLTPCIKFVTNINHLNIYNSIKKSVNVGSVDVEEFLEMGENP